MRTVRGELTESGQADRPAAANGFRLVVDSGRRSSGSSAMAAARSSAGQETFLAGRRARFVTRTRAGPPEDVDVPGRPVSQWMYRRVILTRGPSPRKGR